MPAARLLPASFGDREDMGMDERQPSVAAVARRAVLVFAESVELDLNRRRLPAFFKKLFDISWIDGAATSADVHLFTSRSGKQHAAFTIHRQVGDTFGARLEAAVEKLSQLGYDQIAIVGRDCPHLATSDVTEAFNRLGDHRLVLGPDHRGGCYLIALATRNRHLLRGIRWKRNTDFAQFGDRIPSGKLSVLPVKQDLDSWADVKSLARAGDLLSAFFLKVFAFANTKTEFFVDLAAQRTRVRGQMPPPALAA